jgi:HEAT repeat protein
MSADTLGPPTAIEPMAPDLAARVTAFARACKAAARAVALYPPEHPAVAAALEAVAASAQSATASATLHLTVLPDALTVEGRQLARPDPAVGELADLLHRHHVGQLSIHPQTDTETWRAFLALVALAPDQARLRGGLGRLWASEGETRIELHSLDYNKLLRARARGDKATWEAIVATCTEDHDFSLDETTVELLFGVLKDPARITSVVEAIEACLPSGDRAQQGPLILAGLLHAVAKLVEASDPDAVDSVLTVLAEATARLPLDTLGPIVDTQRESSRPGLARFVQGLVRRMTDESIASLITSEVRGGRGASPRLADALCGLAPEADRRSAIIALARGAVTQSGAAGDASLDRAWQQSEAMLLRYSDEAFVSEAYRSEFGRLLDRAVDLQQDHTDAPAQVEEWRETVDDEELRLLDAALLADMLSLKREPRLWRDLARLVLNRVNVLLVLGDLRAAAVLVEALRSQSEEDPDPEIRAAAGEAVQSLLTPVAMQHVSSHLDTADQAVVRAALRFYAALGTAAIGPLADLLSREQRSRPRSHLISILVAFGAPGRQAVEQLRQSSNAAVRRTAVLLLREFGGHEALPELASLLDDAEPRVQREATHAIAMMGIEAAYDTIVDALARGSETTRTSLLGALWALPTEDAELVLSHLVLTAPYRGAMWEIHARATERLGAIGGRHAIRALAAVLQRRRFWSRLRLARLHRLALDALGRIGTAEALAVIETAAENSSRLVRNAARVRLGAAAAARAREGRTG